MNRQSKERESLRSFSKMAESVRALGPEQRETLAEHIHARNEAASASGYTSALKDSWSGQPPSVNQILDRYEFLTHEHKGLFIQFLDEENKTAADARASARQTATGRLESQSRNLRIER